MVLPQEQKLLGEKAHGYQYCYDRLGNRTEISGPDGRMTQRNLYNQHGELVEQLDGAGSGVEFIYNYGGLREKVRTKGGSTQSYQYDVRGNIIGVEDGIGNRTHFELDDWGRITGIQKADGSYESYQYDYAGNTIKATDGEGNAIQYLYNGANLLEEILISEWSTGIFRL